MRTIRQPFALTLLLACLNCRAGYDPYYERFLTIVGTNLTTPTGIASPSLVDTNNTDPKLLNSVIPLDPLISQGDAGVLRIGMTMGEVVARISMPQTLNSYCGGGPSFWYNDIRLIFKSTALELIRLPEGARFEHDLKADSPRQDWLRVLGPPDLTNSSSSVREIGYNNHGTSSGVLLLYFDPAGEMKFQPDLWRNGSITNYFQAVPDSGFYRRFLSIAGTNALTNHFFISTPSLVDTNNRSAKLPKSAIPLEPLVSKGEIGDLRLGMTMDEVVERWGKPMALYTYCGSGPRFSYADAYLIFAGNSNSLHYLSFLEDSRFEHGLRGDSPLKDWVRVLGKPPLRSDDGYWTKVAYQSTNGVPIYLRLWFLRDGDSDGPPSIWLDPSIPNRFQRAHP